MLIRNFDKVNIGIIRYDKSNNDLLSIFIGTHMTRRSPHTVPI